MSFEDDEYWDEEYSEYSLMPKAAVAQERQYTRRTEPDRVIPTRRPGADSSGPVDELAARRQRLSREAEWLFDNYHIIEDALREIRTDLPRGFYDQLPKLAAGPLAGWPRVYWLAVEVVAHTDSALEEPILSSFLSSYQEVRPLTIGELWAVPIMLRLVLVENLSRIARDLQLPRKPAPGAEPDGPRRRRARVHRERGPAGRAVPAVLGRERRATHASWTRAARAAPVRGVRPLSGRQAARLGRDLRSRPRQPALARRRPLSSW